MFVHFNPILIQKPKLEICWSIWKKKKKVTCFLRSPRFTNRGLKTKIRSVVFSKYSDFQKSAQFTWPILWVLPANEWLRTDLFAGDTSLTSIFLSPLLSLLCRISYSADAACRQSTHCTHCRQSTLAAMFVISLFRPFCTIFFRINFEQLLRKCPVI